MFILEVANIIRKVDLQNLIKKNVYSLLQEVKLDHELFAQT